MMRSIAEGSGERYVLVRQSKAPGRCDADRLLVYDVGTDRQAPTRTLLSTHLIYAVQGKGTVSLSEAGSIGFVRVADTELAATLPMIDSRMAELLGLLLLDSYRTGCRELCEPVARLEERDPFGCSVSGLYRHRVERLLGSLALGIQSDGRERSCVGYLIDRETDTVRACGGAARAAFEERLFEHAELEHAAPVFYGGADGRTYVRLPLRICLRGIGYVTPPPRLPSAAG